MNPTQRKLWKSEQKKVSFVSFVDGNFVQVVGGWWLGFGGGNWQGWWISNLDWESGMLNPLPVLFCGQL